MFPSNWNCSLSIRWCPPRQCLALQFWHWQNCKYPLVQRRMLRSIVGWVRTHNEQWRSVHTTNNGKIRCEKWKVDWNLINLRWRCILFVSGQIVFFPSRQFKFAIHVAQHMPAWPARTVLRHPPTDWGQYFDTKPGRKQGRPAQWWDDHLTQFAARQFGD